MSARSNAIVLAIALVAAACGGAGPSRVETSAVPRAPTATATADPLAAVRADLAPTGKVRVALLAKPPFVATTDATGAMHGVGVELAKMLSMRLGIEASSEIFDAPPDAMKASDRWDVLVAPANGDPATAAAFAFTAPYMLVVHTYLVSDASMRTAADLDKPSVKVAVEQSHAAQVKAQIPNAQLVVVRDDQGLAMFKSGAVAVLAGPKFQLLDTAAQLPGSRVLDGSFFTAELAIGVAKMKTSGAAWLRDFIETQRSSGALQKLADATGKHGLVIPPSGY